MNSALAASFALALALGLGACSGDSEPASAPSTPATATPTPASDGVISPVDLPADPEFTRQGQGVIADVDIASCDTGPGAVTARGSATNSGDATRDVVVTMSWTVSPTDDVVAKGIARVEDLAPGDSADWTITTTVPGSATTACVPTALAGQLKG